MHSYQALPLLCHPTATLQSKVMVQEEYKTPAQSQILPNKATDNLDELAQCEDLCKLLQKRPRGGRLKTYKVAVEFIQKVKV